jgi:hypothetical protein
LLTFQRPVCVTHHSEMLEGVYPRLTDISGVLTLGRGNLFWHKVCRVSQKSESPIVNSVKMRVGCRTQMSPQLPVTQVQQNYIAENGSRRWAYPLSSVQFEFRCKHME